MEAEEPPRPRRAPLQPVLQLRARRRPEKDWGSPGTLGPPPNGWSGKARPSDGVHRLRVDFKEDCALENVWLMGGLSIVSSVPVTAPLVCLLCASKGLHELVLCQVCCQPFHAFCLAAGEAPGPGQAEGWCCRRCKACGVCGRRGRASKPLLECSRCRRCFHPACLGPSAPPRGPRRRGSWLCWGCARCRSCGAPPGRGEEPEWDPEDGLCPPCTRLRQNGSFCPLCARCYEEGGSEPLLRCQHCQRRVHAACEPPAAPPRCPTTS